MRRSKLYKQQREQLGDNQQRYSVLEAIGKLKALPGVKFDQTVEVAIKLGVDTRKSDQTVRGAVPLPRGTGKTVRVAVVADGNAAAEAKEAGADVVGFEDLVQKIKEGFADFDILISTPDAMRLVRPLGRQLGPRGLMPSPRAGTVTPDVAKAISEIKAGKIEYRLDKTNIVHCPIGKVSFGPEKLVENFETLIGAIIKAKPAAAKGQYIKSCVLASTMGPGVKVSTAKY